MTMTVNSESNMLTSQAYQDGLRELASRDPDLARIDAVYGPPPMWHRPPGFPTLVRIILEQQVSLASAEKAFNRLVEAVASLTPQAFLELDDLTLKAIGFSRQKAAYCRGIALGLVRGEFNLENLDRLNDTAARSALMAVKGIGPWSAEIYLLMALLRPDAWPGGDLALMSAVQRIKQLPALPTVGIMDEISLSWRPLRAVAARMLWHFYLEERIKK
jgi:DNA-3-methyladenine glycosylase II